MRTVRRKERKEAIQKNRENETKIERKEEPAKEEGRKGCRKIGNKENKE